MKSLFFKFLVLLTSLLRVVCFLFIILLLITILTQYIDNPQQYPTIMKIDMAGEELSEASLLQIKMAIPYKFNGVDYSKGILIFLLFMVLCFLTYIKTRFRMIIIQANAKKGYDEWRGRIEPAIPKEKMSEIDNKFEELKSTNKTDRKQLLKEFVELKNKLDEMGQQLAFLAIDVVDSTGMKREEDKHLSAYAFDRYNQLVDACLKENGVIKYAKTPDGIMSSFRTVDNAVNAAVKLLERLKDFNQHENQIKHDFQIRCGINAGFVYIDDETPLEQISDRVIDIAGHMQKNAKPDGINIAASAIEPLKNRDGFNETTDVIDEQRVYEWIKR